MMLPTTAHRYHIVALWGLVLTLVLTCSSRSALAQAELPVFAYGVYGDYTIEIREFDPFVVGSETTVGTIPLAQNERLEDIFVAQHGQSLVALLTDGDNITLRQVNLSSGEVSSVTLQGAGFSLLRDLDNPIPLKTIAVLSPDTRYLAVSIYRPDREQGVLIYDTVNQTLAVNTQAGHFVSTMAWANSSDTLAAAVRDCHAATCESRLDLFRPNSAELAESIVVSPALEFRDGTCNLLWSPSDTDISFNQTCDGSYLGGARETYIVNRATHAVRQATTFTPTDVSPSESVFNGTYESIWTSPTTMLISGRFHYGRLTSKDGLITGSINDGDTIATVQVDLDLQIPRDLDGLQRNHFSPSGHGLIAYVKYTYPEETADHPDLPTNAAVEVSSSIELRAVPIVTGASGCDLMWDADGRQLAYILSDSPANNAFCSGDSLQFFNIADRTASQFNLPMYAFPIGWLS